MPALPTRKLLVKAVPVLWNDSAWASRAMIAGVAKAQDPGPGSLVDNPQDVEVTGELPMYLTTFVGRERELDELRSLFRGGKATCHPGWHRRYR